ncbi:MAG TPA: hypothetical protein VE684_07575 [Crenalkalicoccus sp.]|nr:hypothetical protein [Crenalkalicoccus sp.]
MPAVLGRSAGDLDRVYGDGAYAGGPRYRAVAAHRQALPNAEGVFRPKASGVRVAATLDPLTGRGCRNAAECTFSRFKRVLGSGLRSRSLDGQGAEASIAARALNRMAALGLPRAERVA